MLKQNVNFSLCFILVEFLIKQLQGPAISYSHVTGRYPEAIQAARKSGMNRTRITFGITLVVNWVRIIRITALGESTLVKH